jgi:hypothetical protein
MTRLELQASVTQASFMQGWFTMLEHQLHVLDICVPYV